MKLRSLFLLAFVSLTLSSCETLQPAVNAAQRVADTAAVVGQVASDVGDSLASLPGSLDPEPTEAVTEDIQ